MGEKRRGRQGRSKLDMNRFLVQVLILMQKYRPGEITFARVARHCRVPRSTLYYYFGASRVAMVDEAIRYGMSRFVQLQGNSDYTKATSWDAFERKRMRRSLRIMAKYPWVADLYFRYRGESGKFGESILMIESRYFSMMSEAWKHFHGELPDVHGIRMATYLKLGLFFGYSIDRDLWRSARGKEVRDFGLDGFGRLTRKLMVGNTRAESASALPGLARGARPAPGSTAPGTRSGSAQAEPRNGPR
jgi:AcrR family transcriptional regulator